MGTILIPFSGGFTVRVLLQTEEECAMQKFFSQIYNYNFNRFPLQSNHYNYIRMIKVTSLFVHLTICTTIFVLYVLHSLVYPADLKCKQPCPFTSK